MKNEHIKILLDFAEGRMTAEEFWEIFQSKEEFRKEIFGCLEKNKHPEAYFDPISFLSKDVNITLYSSTSSIHGIARLLLQYHKIQHNPVSYYSDRNRFLIKIQPDWLDITDSNEQFLIELVAKCPSDLSETKKIAWCKAKIKELFKFDKTPPRWVQSAEWPIVKGKPLVFKCQSKDYSESDLVKFFFYDPDTKEQTVIEQYY